MIDLHIHTVYSDGEYLPEEITEMVVKEGIDTYAITDHDTILGAKEIRLREGILYIPGVELTARTSMGREHILGYDIDLENSHLNQVLQEKKRIDQQNFLLSYECLISLFSITFPKEELDALLKKPGNIGRVDLAILLKKYGHTKTTDEAFEHYLNPIYEKTRSQKKGMSESE